MNTKQQRKAMQFSGLNDQEQWQPLNASASLKALANMNAVQAGPYRKDASILTSLQNGLLRERIDAAFGMPKRGTTDDAVGGPQSTPKPGNTPLPQPGATPEIDADGLFQKFQTIDPALLTTESKRILNLTIKKLQGEDITGLDYSAIMTTYKRLTEENARNKYIYQVKKDSDPNATWDDSLINNQTVYSSKAGSFGTKGSLSANACGPVAINNANELLGSPTMFEDTCYIIKN